MKKVLLFIVVSALLTACASKFTKVQKSKDVDYKIKMAEQYYAKKKYNYAQILFEEVFPFIKGTPQFEDTYYKFAYCYYYDRDYLNAENLFKTFVETFPNSAKAEECEYMRAYCFYKQSPKVELDQSNTTKTIGLMQAFINTHNGSERAKEAAAIIEKCHEKLELKELQSAQLYYDLGYYKAAAISFANLSDNFPDSKRGDEYKFYVIRAYFKYAEMSIVDKQEERYQKVVTEYVDFAERFKGSKFAEEAEKYKNQSVNFIKTIKDEQAKKAA
jgi:outer membrane protein assembly factor BamD